MASNDFECRNRSLSTLSSSKERANSRPIALEKVSLAAFKMPFASFLEFCESILLKRISAPLDCVEVTLRIP